jgi:hypothetical protein
MPKEQITQSITTEPKPCKRFAKRTRLNESFLAHLPDCEECKALFFYLDRESRKYRARLHGSVWDRPGPK